MTSTIYNTVGVVGSDGVTPVIEPDSRWTQWRLNQVFMGPDTPGEGRYVPKVNDWVIDTDAVIFYEVESVDVVTLKPTFKEIKPLAQNQTFDDIDVILGAGPGTITDTFRVYINKSVIPHTVSIDARLHTYASAAERYTIFRGNDPEGAVTPISQLYDSGNSLIGTSIPLQLAETTGDNRTVKSFPMCYTNEDIPNGEKLVLITYSDAGHQVARADLLVENTQFTPVADASTKYITAISLQSPFISPSDPSQLRFPLNVPVNGLSLIGVVQYNDGSSASYPVNGTKFALRGLDNFISSYAGQKFDLVLDYKLSPNEVAAGFTTTPAGSITKQFSGITTNFEGMYSPKLYGYPVWQDSVSGYRLEWWLYDMERSMAQLVTPYVKINNNSPVFNPTGYGFIQSLGVTINLKDVNPGGLAFNHVQTIDIVLRQPGDSRNSNWAIGFEPNQTELFGEGNHAISHIVDQNNMTLDISCGETILANWLDRVYRLTKPLTDLGREAKAPDPTHFSVVVVGNNRPPIINESPYSIDKWNQLLTLTNTLPDNSTVYIKFFIRTADTDIQLSIAGMPVYQQ